MTADQQPQAQEKRSPVFYPVGTTEREHFTEHTPTRAFDVANESDEQMLLVFESQPGVTVSPGIIRLAPAARSTVLLNLRSSGEQVALHYHVAHSTSPFRTHSDSYRAYSDGETVMCVPIAPELHTAMRARAEAIIAGSKEPVTDPHMPPGTSVYTPGPFYRQAGLFARDLLYQLEGSGRFIAAAEDVKRAVDFLTCKQLPASRRVGAYTYPRGAIPDHVYPDGRFCWGPGAFYGDDTAHFNRPSMDAALCFIILAWHYGFLAQWDAAWQTWFIANQAHFDDAWHSVPRNPATRLVTQWTTPGHIGADGIAEYDGACVMWGFHDSYGFGGDDLGVSVLACNAGRALADMHAHAGDGAQAQTWASRAVAMQDAIRAHFNPAGYLPWGAGPAAPEMASPDITGYAVWSGILSGMQADAASDWLAACYKADRAQGGAADLFNMNPGCRGAVRMARKSDDCAPGRHVWPDMTRPHWENLTYGYNAYQDGGYWYYMCLGIAATLWRKHPAEASEWVRHTYTDIITAGDDAPYERIDGARPENNRYNASIGPVLGMGLPSLSGSVRIMSAAGST